MVNFSSSFNVCVCVCARVRTCARLCPTLGNPMDYSPPGSPVHGIFQARILEWVTVPFSRGSSWPRDWICISCASWIGRWIFYHHASWEASITVSGLVAKSCLTLANPQTEACQAPLSMGFSRQEYWSGLPYPSPGDFPNQGIEPRSPALQANSLLIELPGKNSTVSVYPQMLNIGDNSCLGLRWCMGLYTLICKNVLSLYSLGLVYTSDFYFPFITGQQQ